MTEEQWGQLWAELARKERHRPLHLSGVSHEEAKARGRKKGRQGENVEKLRQCAAEDLYLSEAARKIGISPSTAKYLATKHGVVFRRGNTMEGRRG